MTRTKTTLLALFAVLLSPLAANADPIVYSTHGDGTRIGTIDAATGVGIDIGATGQTQGWAAAFGTDGTLYTTYNGFSGNAQLATVDTSTGAISSTIGSLGTSLIALEVSSTGGMYGVGYTDRVLYSIDSTSGAVTVIGDTGISATMDLAFDSAGTLYSTVGNNLWTLDLLTGSSTLVTTFSGILSGSVMGIMFDEFDNLFATAYVPNSPFYGIDIGTGVATVVGSTGFLRPHGGDIFISVPEPGTLALLGIGLFGMGMARRRKV